MTLNRGEETYNVGDHIRCVVTVKVNGDEFVIALTVTRCEPLLSWVSIIHKIRWVCGECAACSYLIEVGRTAKCKAQDRRAPVGVGWKTVEREARELCSQAVIWVQP
jgi:hypothetical protein